MSGIVVVILGVAAGFFTMAILSFYKWFLEVYNKGF
jgi:hypothetical protein